MVKPAATGCLSKFKEQIGNTIAGCPIFQALTGSADATEALTHIYFEILPRTDDDDVDFEALSKVTQDNKRPFCVVFVDMPAQVSINRVASGGTFVFNASAVVMCEIGVDDILNDPLSYYSGSDSAETIQDYACYVDNFLGEFAEQYSDLAGDGLLEVNQFDRRASAENEKFSNGEFIMTLFFMNYGVE